MRFFITGLYHTTELNDSTLPAIEVEAVNRIDALCRLNATVWTEDEFKGMKADSSMQMPEPIKWRC